MRSLPHPAFLDASPSGSVVKDDAQSEPFAPGEAAHPVAHVRPIRPARAGDGPVARGKDDRLALLERNHAPPRLRAGPLLDEQELAALEILPRLAQEHRELDGEDDLAVDVLV